MRFLFFISIIYLSSVSCTVYESEGREALKENKNNIITVTGFNDEGSIKYTCYHSGAAPAELSGPLEVIESQYDSQGFSSYLNKSSEQVFVLVYENKEETKNMHSFCRLNLLKEADLELSYEAIDLGVFHLLDPDTRP